MGRLFQTPQTKERSSTMAKSKKTKPAAKGTKPGMKGGSKMKGC